ncbi:hypothetical protein TI39_contig860g00001 [Zymoseptoria brevis]|uniref:Secreted protein n=1 Tax=Zymoseptoria brevis TaxID=1047168 RepID=A0A0F4GF07_9PEZI|nr:hypothetical protein TI39_contig860g00001 [Zymoseptoria brevis]
MPSFGSHLLALVHLALIPYAMADCSGYQRASGKGNAPLPCQTYQAPSRAGQKVQVNGGIDVTCQSRDELSFYLYQNEADTPRSFQVQYYHVAANPGTQSYNAWVSYTLPGGASCVDTFHGYMEIFKFNC